MRGVKYMTKLSKRQQAIIDFIKKEVNDKGYPPSVREIAKAVNLASSSTVHGHLSRLENKGYIRRDPTKPRAIEVLDKTGSEDIPTGNVQYAPVIGKVTAGMPITAIENIEEYIPLPGNSNSDENIFILIIEGDSMIEAGILNGDMVIVKQQNSAENGDIIVAMTEEDEATVKRFFKEENHIRLQPENATMEPLIYENVSILGKVTGLYRNIH